MMNKGKSINLFLMDGESTGRIKCTMANWTGITYKIPRVDLEKSKDRNDLFQSGVYLLFGIDEETLENVVYIGQASIRKNGQGILGRLMEHTRNTEKNYWNEAVILTTQNNSFGPTEISYLENRFVELAIKADRYVVKNISDPNPGNVTEEKESELEEFIEYSKITIGALGYKVFVPLVNKKVNDDSNDDSKEDEITLYLKRKTAKSGYKEIKARCKRTSEGFVVLAGSMIDLVENKYIANNIKEARAKAKISEDGILQEDFLMFSPSGASDFVLGTSSNGRTEWKTIDGITLKQLEEDMDELH